MVPSMEFIQLSLALCALICMCLYVCFYIVCAILLHVGIILKMQNGVKVKPGHFELHECAGHTCVHTHTHTGRYREKAVGKMGAGERKEIPTGVFCIPRKNRSLAGYTEPLPYVRWHID